MPHGNTQQNTSHCAAVYICLDDWPWPKRIRHVCRLCATLLDLTCNLVTLPSQSATKSHPSVSPMAQLAPKPICSNFTTTCASAMVPHPLLLNLPSTKNHVDINVQRATVPVRSVLTAALPSIRAREHPTRAFSSGLTGCPSRDEQITVSRHRIFLPLVGRLISTHNTFLSLLQIQACVQCHSWLD